MCKYHLLEIYQICYRQKEKRRYVCTKYREFVWVWGVNVYTIVTNENI